MTVGGQGAATGAGVRSGRCASGRVCAAHWRYWY